MYTLRGGYYLNAKRILSKYSKNCNVGRYTYIYFIVYNKLAVIRNNILLRVSRKPRERT